MRRLAIVVLAAALAALAGCERVASLGESVSRQAFERRCEGLPPGRIEVVRKPNEVVTDTTLTQRELERLAVDARSPHHRTVGLTRASFGYRTTIDLDGLEDTRGARACTRPGVRVEVELSGLTVHVAREFRDDPCRAPRILAHERRHVEVFERYADEAARALAREVDGHVGRGVRFGPTMADIQEKLKAELTAWLDEFMAGARSELAARNAAIDSEEEYASLAQACGPAY